MSTVAIPAHFDGKQIVLDKAVVLPINANLLVTVLPDAENDDDETAWLKSAADSDAFAFLRDPREDIYSASDGEPYPVR